MDEADFFGDGVLKGDFVYKAHLRVQVRPHPVAAVQEAVDGVASAYDDVAKSIREAVLDASKRAPFSKAAPQLEIVRKGPPGLPGAGQFRIKHPGSRGGKWWRDKGGNIRYGAQPGPADRAAAAPQGEDADDLSHYKPSSFGHAKGSHEDVMQHLAGSEDHAFSQGELGFLDWWHDRGVRNLVEQYGGLTTDDLDKDVDGLRLQNDAGDLSYGEAAHDFFASQDWGGADFESDVAPLLGDLLGRFHEAADDPKTAAAIDKKKSAKMRRWFAKATKFQSRMRKLGTVISSSTDSRLTAQEVIAALLLLDLVQDLRKQGVAVASPNQNLLGEGLRRLGSFVQEKFGKSFSSLASVQLMLAYMGASLNSIWDSKNQNYYTGGGIPDTSLGGLSLQTLAKKSGLDERVSILRDHLKEVTLSVANLLNQGVFS